MQHATAVVGHELFLHGGYNGREYLDDFHVLDTKCSQWTQLRVNGEGPSACYGHTLSVVNNELYLLFGGTHWDQVYLNKMYILNLATLSWSNRYMTGTEPQVCQLVTQNSCNNDNDNKE